MIASEAVPAATTVLLRDGPHGVETLMVRRSEKLSFAAGYWVFPGGRIDPEDVDPDRPEDEEAAARRGAVREALEEASLVLDPVDLVLLSRWCPPPEAPKRFNTWFFVGLAPEVHDVLVDGGEIDDHRWIRPTEAIRLREAGEITIIPPTWLTLHQLSGYANAVEAVEAVGRSVPRLWVTRRVKAPDGTPCTVWEPDAAHRSGDLSTPGPRNRLIMADSGWRYEVSG